MKYSMLAMALLAATAMSVSAGAQKPEKIRKTGTKPTLPVKNWGRTADDIPPGHRPPPGMCRIWIDGVPPGHQPAPTDCATAVRTRPANGRVIYGDDYRKPGRSEGRKDDEKSTKTNKVKPPKRSKDADTANRIRLEMLGIR